MNVEVDLYIALKSLGKGEPRIISAAVYILANLVEPNLVEHKTFVCHQIPTDPSSIYLWRLNLLGPTYTWGIPAKRFHDHS